MRTLTQQLAQYAEYHRDRRNIATHFIGIPLIVLSLPLCVSLLWTHYTAVQIPGGQFEIMPSSDWRWALLPSILGSVGRVMISKPGSAMTKHTRPQSSTYS